MNTSDLLLQRVREELSKLFENSYSSSSIDSYFSRRRFDEFFWSRIKGLFTMNDYPSYLDFS